MTLRIGTRSSQLALWQANRVREELEAIGLSVEIIHIKTAGDKNHTDSISRIGAQGAFTKEIQYALLENQIDVAVHSLKDLPTDPVPGLIFASTLDREDVSDVFISRKWNRLEELPNGTRLGTGSLRRKCQAAYRLQDRAVIIEDIRGNLETRIRKLENGEFDAILLAAAGLRRLGFTEYISEDRKFDPLDFYPAVGQGALGLECRENDSETRSILTRVNRKDVYLAVTAERAFLTELRGGCIAPIGAYARFVQGKLLFNGRILSLDGKRQFDVALEETLSGDWREHVTLACQLGKSAAGQLSGSEVQEILAAIRQLRGNL